MKSQIGTHRTPRAKLDEINEYEDKNYGSVHDNCKTAFMDTTPASKSKNLKARNTTEAKTMDNANGGVYKNKTLSNFFKRPKMSLKAAPHFSPIKR
jgi:hypothetical protein